MHISGISCRESCGRARTYVAMTTKVLKKLDLSQSPLGKDLLAEDVGDLFDSDSISSETVRCRATIGVRKWG